MLKIGMIFAILFFLVACASQESKFADYLKKNPKLIFDAIEENPEQFVEAVNRAARKAQEVQYKKQESENLRQQEQQLKNPLKPSLNEQSLLYGSLDSPIVVVEYADFQCPACRMAYNSLMKLKERYGEKIQIHYKHFPLDFHKMAMPSAKYFEAIKLQDVKKVQKFYQLIFEKQDQLKDVDFLQKVSKQIGVNLIDLNKSIDSKKVEKVIDSDMLEFQKFGFTGTPVLIVNGVAMQGAQPLEEIEKVIELTRKIK